MSNAQEKGVNRIAELKGFRLEGFSVFEAHEPFGQNVWTGPKLGTIWHSRRRCQH